MLLAAHVSLAAPRIPGPRMLHTAIYDPVHQSLLVYGGLNSAHAYRGVWATPTDAVGAWRSLPLAGGPDPGPRRDHVAVYDAKRQRMLVYGGSGAQDGPLGDVWALSLAGSSAWREIVPDGEEPPARFSHAGIYDPARDRLVVFGGWTGDEFDDRVWALALTGQPRWAELATDGDAPSPRDAMTAVYDPERDRMIVFGGWAADHFENDTWQLALADRPRWSRLPTTGAPPSPRRHYAAAFDPEGNRLVLTGGEGDDGDLDDVWTLRFDDAGRGRWQEEHPRGTPPSPRNGHRAVLDAPRHRLLLFGGYDGDYCGDLWTLSLDGRMAWRCLHGESPGRRRQLGPPRLQETRVRAPDGAVRTSMGPALTARPRDA